MVDQLTSQATLWIDSRRCGGALPNPNRCPDVAMAAGVYVCMCMCGSSGPVQLLFGAALAGKPPAWPGPSLCRPSRRPQCHASRTCSTRGPPPPRGAGRRGLRRPPPRYRGWSVGSSDSASAASAGSIARGSADRQPAVMPVVVETDLHRPVGASMRIVSLTTPGRSRTGPGPNGVGDLRLGRRRTRACRQSRRITSGSLGRAGTRRAPSGCRRRFLLE